MGEIAKITGGSLAKSKKTNEIIDVLNALQNMTVRQGSASEMPKLVVADLNSELITTAGEEEGEEEELLEGFVETDFIMCVNGAPVAGKILFKAD